MPQVPNAMRVFLVLRITTRKLVRSLDIPIQAWPLDTNGELIKWHYFIAPARDMDPLSLGLHQKCIVEAFVGISNQIEDRRMAPFAACRNANQVGKYFFRVFVFAQHNVSHTHKWSLITILQKVIEWVRANMDRLIGYNTPTFQNELISMILLIIALYCRRITNANEIQFFPKPDNYLEKLRKVCLPMPPLALLLIILPL